MRADLCQHGDAGRCLDCRREAAAYASCNRARQAAEAEVRRLRETVATARRDAIEEAASVVQHCAAFDDRTAARDREIIAAIRALAAGDGKGGATR